MSKPWLVGYTILPYGKQGNLTLFRIAARRFWSFLTLEGVQGIESEITCTSRFGVFFLSFVRLGGVFLDLVLGE